jgi:predicted nuclease with TOPRIM domain
VNNQEILDNAPDGTTHLQYCSDGIDICYLKIDENFYFHDDKTWRKVSPLLTNIKSLADIKRIAELSKERDQILNSALDSESNCCDLKERNAELEKERDDLNGKFEEYFDAFMNCKCIPRNMEVHNLEQQVKGAENIIDSVLGEPESLTSECLSIRYEFLDRLKQLREQAKQLKGGAL